MNIVPIVFAFDENLILPAGVCLTSLLENAKEDTFYDIFILHSSKVSFSDTLLTQFPQIYKNCKITFREVDSYFDACYEVRGITSCTYYRLIIPDLIPEYDKILYSDVDVIFRDDLSVFYEIDIEDYYLAGVDNCSFLRPDMQYYINNELGLDYTNGFFYAGNLLINSKLIRKDNIVAKFKELSYNKYKHQDLDIINIVCNKRIKTISPAFCMTNYIYDLLLNKKKEMLLVCTEQDIEYTLSKGIVHYNGPKPWKEWCHNFDIWWYYYRKSFFYSEYSVFAFYQSRMSDIDALSLLDRIKLLLKYFKSYRRQ